MLDLDYMPELTSLMSGVIERVKCRKVHPCESEFFASDRTRNQIKFFYDLFYEIYGLPYFGINRSCNEGLVYIITIPRRYFCLFTTAERNDIRA